MMKNAEPVLRPSMLPTAHIATALKYAPVHRRRRCSRSVCLEHSGVGHTAMNSTALLGRSLGRPLYCECLSAFSLCSRRGRPLTWLWDHHALLLAFAQWLVQICPCVAAATLDQRWRSPSDF